jgi:AcrR family transcriptional regulator
MLSMTNRTPQNILNASAALFATKGFDALTMRDIATACHIKAPSLYNHFKDKQTLYEATLQHVFHEHGTQLMICLAQPLASEEKLISFIQMVCQQLSEDAIFRQLFLRELIAQETERARFMVQVVMAETCRALHDVFLDINPNCDPHFLTTSLMGLLLFHFQINPLRSYLPGGNESKQSLDYLTNSITQLMCRVSIDYQ